MWVRAAGITALLLSGCTSIAIGAADPAALHSTTLVETCPLGVPWTRVRLRDTADGVALDFTTPPSNVGQLRRRVYDQSRAYGPDRHRGLGHDGAHRGNRSHGLRLWTMGELRTQVEETPTGATLTIAPVDPERRNDLRTHIAHRVAHLEAACLH